MCLLNASSKRDFPVDLTQSHPRCVCIRCGRVGSNKGLVHFHEPRSLGFQGSQDQHLLCIHQGDAQIEHASATALGGQEVNPDIVGRRTTLALYP